MKYGSVKADSNFSCNDSSLQSDVEKRYGLNKICDSKNNIEIRLSGEYFPFLVSQLYVLTNNGSTWTATEYESHRHYKESDSLKRLSSFSIKSQEIIKKLFDTLIQNNVFNLPNQTDLKVQEIVYDGSFYSLTFKIQMSLGSIDLIILIFMKKVLKRLRNLIIIQT